MNTKSNLFLSTDLDSRSVSNALSKDITDGQFGYFLIRDRLVPYVMIDNLAQLLSGTHIEYAQIYDPADHFGDIFEEMPERVCQLLRPIFSECLLLLIEQGRIIISFPDEMVDQEGDRTFSRTIGVLTINPDGAATKLSSTTMRAINVPDHLMAKNEMAEIVEV